MIWKEIGILHWRAEGQNGARYDVFYGGSIVELQYGLTIRIWNNSSQSARRVLGYYPTADDARSAGDRRERMERALTEVSEDRYIHLESDVDDEAFEIIAGTTVTPTKRGRKKLLDTIRDNFTKLPLVDRMQLCAGTIECARDRWQADPDNKDSGWIAEHWSADDMRRWASKWDRDWAAEVERRKLLDELVALLTQHDTHCSNYPELADRIIKAGWTKKLEEETP